MNKTDEKEDKNKTESSRCPSVVTLRVTVLLPNPIDTPFTASTVM